MTTTLYLVIAIRVPHSQNTSASHCPNLVRKQILKNFYGTQLVVNQSMAVPTLNRESIH
jgi:hypothetical protein